MRSVDDLLRRVEAAAREQRRLLDVLPRSVIERDGGLVKDYRHGRMEGRRIGDTNFQVLSSEEHGVVSALVVEARNGELAEMALQLVQAIRENGCG